MNESCETPGCDKEAKLQCPTCIKLHIKVSITLPILKINTELCFHFSFNPKDGYM